MTGLDKIEAVLGRLKTKEVTYSFDGRGRATAIVDEALAVLRADVARMRRVLEATDKWLGGLPTDDQLDRPAYGERLTGRQICGMISDELADKSGGLEDRS